MEKQTEIYQFENRQQYLEALDSVLPEKYQKTRSLGSGRSVTYIPIPIQEAVADMLWQEWNIVDEQYTIMVNEVICTVKIAYVPSYPGAEEQFCTGSAAKPIQMKSGSKVSDFPAAKVQNALEYNLPSVRSTAIGSALESNGNIFGRNVGRKIDGDNIPSNFTLRKQTKKSEENGDK